MLYLDYAKPLADGKYILSFFADSVADLESISHGQKFVTKNGTDYGVPQAGSTVIVTSPNSGKTTYVMDAEGIWVVTEDISYSAVVANPSDAATAKLEKLKVNDTTYANWTENEIKSIASESGAKINIYQMQVSFDDHQHSRVSIDFPTTRKTITADEAFELTGFFTGHISQTPPIPVYFEWQLIDSSKPQTPDNLKINAYKMSDDTLYATFVKSDYDRYFLFEL